MRISDLFRFSTDNLRRRKGRTVLTIIGVVVGVCAIVVMISLGIAVNQATDAMLQNWGDLRSITVYSYGAQPDTPDLDDTMVSNFKNMEHVAAATPMYESSHLQGAVTAGSGGRYIDEYPMLIGMDPDALQPMEYELVTGNFLGNSGSRNNDRIEVMVGANVIFEFADSRKGYNNPNRQKYPEYPPYEESGPNARPTNLPQYDEGGQLLNPEAFFFDIMHTPLTYRMAYGTDETTGQPQYKDYDIVVTGILYSQDYSIANGFVMSVESMKKLEKDYKRLSNTPDSPSGGGGMMGYSIMGGFGGGESTVQVGGYERVYVKVDSVDNMVQVEKSLMGLGYQIGSMSQMREEMQGQVAQTRMMLGSLAAVSLFVAALNIANTMTMAIYERTREIGVMKVLGCRLPNIRTMFLIESGAIGLLGGVIGVVVSIIISFTLNHLTDILAFLGISSSVDLSALFGLGGMLNMPDMKLSVIPLWLILLALCFATGVGVVSGIAPAGRAVKISSLEAIRHE